MTKLTNWMRETIAKSVMQHRFSDAAVAIVKERAAFAMEVYRDIYSEAERRRMKALPAGWLPSEDDISAQFGDGRHYEQVNFSGAVYGSISKMLPEAIDRVYLPVAYAHRSGCAKSYEPTDDLSVRYVALKEKTEELSRQIDSAQRQTDAAIANATTIGRLVEMWPEIEPFTTVYEGDKPRTLPAIPTSQLNALLDLPISEAA